MKRNNIGDFLTDAQGTPLLDQANGTDVMIGTVGILGLGVNLQRSAYEILMEPQLQHSTTYQAVKRVHRIGQQHPTVVEVLISNTVQAERVVQDRRLLIERFSKMVLEAKVNLGISLDAESESSEDEGIA